MALRILRPDTAFQNAPSKGQKRQREHDRSHMAWVSTLPCLITGRRPVDVAHIRYGDPGYGKRETGKSEKPHDKFTVPLSREMHDEQHAMSERMFWIKHGIDPLKVALALWSVSGDDEQGELIIRTAKP